MSDTSERGLVFHFLVLITRLTGRSSTSPDPQGKPNELVSRIGLLTATDKQFKDRNIRRLLNEYGSEA